MGKIIIANWKSHPATLEEAQELFKAEMEAAQKYPKVQTIIYLPDMFLEQLTGSAVRTDYVLVGHSSQRELGETDKQINQKIKNALMAGVTPVLFIGEREGESREEILTVQLTKDLADLSADQISKILFAYEPVWAISRPAPDIASVLSPQRRSGPDTPENVLETIRFIDSFLTTNYPPAGRAGKLKTINYLYGGSVNEKNVADFLSKPEISGAVVGKASLDPDQFYKILEIVNNI